MVKLTRREAEGKIKEILNEYVGELEKGEKIKKQLAPAAQALIAEKGNIKKLIHMPGFESVIFDNLNLEGIGQLLNGCRRLAEKYELSSYEGVKTVEIIENEQLYNLLPVITGSIPLSEKKIEEGRQVVFQLGSERKYEKRKGESIYPVWNRYKVEGEELAGYTSLTDTVKDIADDNNWDRGFLFDKQGQYKVSADIYKKDTNGNVELLEHHEYDVEVVEAAYSEVVNLTNIEKIGKAISYSDFSEQVPNLVITAGMIAASTGVLALLSKFKLDRIVKVLAPLLQWIGFAGDIAEFSTAIGLMYSFIELAVNAKSEEGLKEAGKVFSAAAVAMGLAVLFKFLEWSSSKYAGEEVKRAESGKEIVVVNKSTAELIEAVPVRKAAREVLVEAGYSRAHLVDDVNLQKKVAELQRYMSDEVLCEVIKRNRAKDTKLETFLDIEIKNIFNQYSIKRMETSLMEANLSVEKIQEIVLTPKGKRPVPESYLSDKYIETHLMEFREGVSYVLTRDQYEQFIVGRENLGYPDNSLFVTSKSFLDSIESLANNDVNFYESMLGFEKDYFKNGGGLVRVDIKIPEIFNMRLPSGNEMGANSFFTPGGYTSGGTPEIVLDCVPNKSEYVTITFIKE